MIVYQQQVLGTGTTRDEALQNAEASLSPEIEEITAMVEWVGQRIPRGRLRVQ